MKYSIASLLALTFVAAAVAAPMADPTTKPAAPSAYPLTTDVITGAPLGEHPIVDTIDGREVRSATAESAAQFKAGGEESQKKMDAQVIDAQKDSYKVETCLVSGEKLGGDMGEPILHVHRATNQLVKFCCGGCVKKFKDDPAPYLAKVNEANAK